MDLTSDIREQVRSQTDIVALIGEAVALTPQRGGREHVGLCCFHDDHNPSMRVYADRQSYRCWVCNAGGDCFSFVMEREKIGFREALELLAKRAHIKLPEFAGRRGDEDTRTAVYEVLLWAQELFHKTFLGDPLAAAARDYIHSRGMTSEMVKQFRIGYHPNSWDWLQSQARGKFKPDLLLAARLIGQRDNGPGFHDFFVDRVLFPIRNERGQAVGFGGRILPGSTHPAKYWNSPESPVFLKSKLVFALDAARDEIRKTETALICEGYTDVIACHQYGVKNAVATLGTALTDQHVTILKRFARKVVLVYDGDAAGMAAAERVLERFIVQDVDLRILTLPEGLDPDEFLAAKGGDALRALVESAPEALDFKLRCLHAKYPSKTLDSRQRILEEMLQVLASAPRMSQHVREGLLLAALAERLGLREEQVRDRLQEVRIDVARRAPRPSTSMSPQAPHQVPPQRPHSANGESFPTRSEPQRTIVPSETGRLFAGRLNLDDQLECELLEIVLTVPALTEIVRSAIATTAIRHPQLQLLLAETYRLGGNRSWTFESLLGALEDPELKRLAVWLDERARAKDLAAKLREPGADSDETCPPFLRRSIDAFHWRREEQSQLQRVAPTSPASGEGSPPSEEADQLLRQAYQFHQRRATKRTGA